MARNAIIITLDQFKKICVEKLKIGTEDFDFYELPPQIEKDLAKVDFDRENYCIGNADPMYEKYPSDHSGFSNYPCGYEVLENGLPVLFANSGGDWEFPICFVLYWDGKKMRAYIPEDGNIFHKKEKCAYGSDSEETDQDSLPKPEPQKIRNDILKRIQII